VLDQPTVNSGSAEPYTSIEAQAVHCAITMLAGSATFRTLVGAADAAAALASIIEHDGGSPLDNGADGIATSCNGTAITLATASFALVVQTDVVADADQQYGWQFLSGKIEVLIHVPAIPGLLVHQRTRYAWTLSSAIQEELRAQIGAPGCLALCGIAASTHPLPDDVGAESGGIAARLAIDWRNG
jgi:hypothetical protein